MEGDIEGLISNVRGNSGLDVELCKMHDREGDKKEAVDRQEV